MPPPHQLEGLGDYWKLLSGVPSGAPAANAFLGMKKPALKMDVAAGINFVSSTAQILLQSIELSHVVCSRLKLDAYRAAQNESESK